MTVKRNIVMLTSGPLSVGSGSMQAINGSALLMFPVK